ncbi:hypothetical protein RI103_35445 [Paraburkholderia sp. FT54]|uniref:hypothetical protein n=1 Tax=Paraburkholderia sp. FT54 TaxID=3074437 RepID=UPI00287778B7|nr:hypothetical protein [Paraburkholderia sp. FT54]WNC94456.1 hypothetical protein RI103_35445 [Paraburkholderia sp. FT54]
MGLLNWLFHRERVHVSPMDAARIDEAVERILAIHPRLKMAIRYRHRLKRPVAATLHYADQLIASLPATLEANSDAWSSNPCLRAFFATPDDIARAFGHSDEVRAFFERNPDAVNVYGTLGMALTERHVLGVVLDGDTVRHDVAQTTLCFSDHRVRICGRTELGLRQEIVRRLIDQFALEGLSRLATDRAKLLARGRELMQERVDLLHRQGTGIRSVVGGGATAQSEELTRVQAQMAENSQSLAALRVPTDIIELGLKGICEVFSKPSEYAYIKNRKIRIDMMNVVQESNAQGGREIEFHFARIPGPTPETRAFALVRFNRSDLPPGGLNIDAAMRAF